MDSRLSRREALGIIVGGMSLPFVLGTSRDGLAAESGSAYAGDAHQTNFVDEYVPGVDAVRISTINSARAIGLDKDFGSIEAGKVADFAIVNGDPLEDFRAVGSRVAALFVDGKLLINNCGLEVKAGAASA